MRPETMEGLETNANNTHTTEHMDPDNPMEGTGDCLSTEVASSQSTRVDSQSETVVSVADEVDTSTERKSPSADIWARVVESWNRGPNSLYEALVNAQSAPDELSAATDESREAVLSTRLGEMQLGGSQQSHRSDSKSIPTSSSSQPSAAETRPNQGGDGLSYGPVVLRVPTNRPLRRAAVGEERQLRFPAYPWMFGPSLRFALKPVEVDGEMPDDPDFDSSAQTLRHLLNDLCNQLDPTYMVEVYIPLRRGYLFHVLVQLHDVGLRVLQDIKGRDARPQILITIKKALMAWSRYCSLFEDRFIALWNIWQKFIRSAPSEFIFGEGKSTSEEVFIWLSEAMSEKIGDQGRSGLLQDYETSVAELSQEMSKDKDIKRLRKVIKEQAPESEALFDEVIVYQPTWTPYACERGLYGLAEMPRWTPLPLDDFWGLFHRVLFDLTDFVVELDHADR